LYTVLFLLSFIAQLFQKQPGLLFACKLIRKKKNKPSKNPVSLLGKELILEFPGPEIIFQVSDYFPNGELVSDTFV